MCVYMGVCVFVWLLFISLPLKISAVGRDVPAAGGTPVPYPIFFSAVIFL